MVGYIKNESSPNKLVGRTCCRNFTNAMAKDAVVESKSLPNIYRAKVIDAYRNRRIFTVFGKCNILRRLLNNRGWLEKLPPDRFSNLQNLSEEVVLAHAKEGNVFETVIISKVINHFPAFFVWQSKCQRDLYADVLPYRNRLRMPRYLDFSTKIGLVACAEQRQWYPQNGVVGMTHPRFFRLGENQEEQLVFIDEYRMTQCCSLLRYLVENCGKRKDLSDYETGTIQKTVIEFAVVQVRRKLDDCVNCDFMDVEKYHISEEDWECFLEHSSEIINERKKVKCTYQDLAELIKTSKNLLMKMEEKYPDMKWDGYKNLWILKPGYMNRGRGIVIFNNLKKILHWGITNSSYHYIVQKYIERPLLIYGTKFDIRQYMLICVRTSTVQIWIYTGCYLRFSSQEYCTDNLDESIHLTNNCVQKKYKNNIKRDARLPQNNMWSLEQFKFYLNSKMLPENFWENRILAAFRAQIIAVVLPSLEETNFCENSFELFGCDFMLDEEYNPILIEINASPDLSPSTTVTARICPMVLEDCLKVVIDLPSNNRSSTGLFKMIYEVNYKFKQNPNGREGLNVCGKTMELCKPTPHTSLQLKLNKRLNVRKTKLKAGKKTPQLSERIFDSYDGTEVLEAATKEALALRYTMPK